jgi:hypothetical protein
MNNTLINNISINNVMLRHKYKTAKKEGGGKLYKLFTPLKHSGAI